MKQARIPNAQEFKRLVVVVMGGRHAVRNRLALMLSYFGGLRACEIAALNQGDVCEPNWLVRDEVRLAPGQTKGATGRVFFVGRKLRNEIEGFVRDGVRQYRAEEPLLVSQKGSRFSANTMCQLLGTLYRKAGVDGATSHSGRRAFITQLAHKGISAKIIMTLVGHKHMTTTQRYIDVNDQLLRSALEVFD